MFSVLYRGPKPSDGGMSHPQCLCSASPYIALLESDNRICPVKNNQIRIRFWQKQNLTTGLALRVLLALN